MHLYTVTKQRHYQIMATVSRMFRRVFETLKKKALEGICNPALWKRGGGGGYLATICVSGSLISSLDSQELTRFGQRWPNTWPWPKGWRSLHGSETTCWYNSCRKRIGSLVICNLIKIKIKTKFILMTHKNGFCYLSLCSGNNILKQKLKRTLVSHGPVDIIQVK